jgi:hypothetical protein
MSQKTDIQLRIEQLYREYFYDIRGFKPFPMELSFDNVMDFVLWLKEQGELSCDAGGVAELREAGNYPSGSARNLARES